MNLIASASSPDCSAGIESMRIYTAPGDGVYTTDSNHLDANLTLAAGFNSSSNVRRKKRPRNIVTNEPRLRMKPLALLYRPGCLCLQSKYCFCSSLLRTLKSLWS